MLANLVGLERRPGDSMQDRAGAVRTGFLLFEHHLPVLQAAYQQQHLPGIIHPGLVPDTARGVVKVETPACVRALRALPRFLERAPGENPGDPVMSRQVVVFTVDTVHSPSQKSKARYSSPAQRSTVSIANKLAGRVARTAHKPITRIHADFMFDSRAKSGSRGASDQFQFSRERCVSVQARCCHCRLARSPGWIKNGARVSLECGGCNPGPCLTPFVSQPAEDGRIEPFMCSQTLWESLMRAYWTHVSVRTASCMQVGCGARFLTPPQLSLHAPCPGRSLRPTRVIWTGRSQGRAAPWHGADCMIRNHGSG